MQLSNMQIVESCGSTQDLIKQLPLNTAVIAREQTDGRGRDGSSWITQKDCSLMFSYSYQIPNTRYNCDNIGNNSIFVGLALINMLKTYGIIADLKFPNDVIIVKDNQVYKIAGILCEMADENSEFITINVGVGLNMFESQKDLEKVSSKHDYIQPASLQMLGLIDKTEYNDVCDLYKEMVSNFIYHMHKVYNILNC